MKEDFLTTKLRVRADAHALRGLRLPGEASDFYSNDYLGIAKNKLIEIELGDKSYRHGSTGSRLLSGNYALIEDTEVQIADFHKSPAALIFNSGYDANFGLLACIGQRGDCILYDKLSHASIRDGIRQSFALSFSFLHNDLADLEKKLKQVSASSKTCFVVTESVFSMDGDIAPLSDIISLCEKYNANLILDEAHATGVIGDNGEGLAQSLNLHERCFARIHTFGKALACHGAVILGSDLLKKYLINFCRPLIYSTAIPPSAVAAIAASYKIFPGLHAERLRLRKLIAFFSGDKQFGPSPTPIQYIVIPGNEKVKNIASELLKNDLDIRPIIYPTVPLGQERLRITLHSFNTYDDTQKIISLIADLNT
jgi:8-amino-7-oxononanoate synthase